MLTYVHILHRASTGDYFYIVLAPVHFWYSVWNIFILQMLAKIMLKTSLLRKWFQIELKKNSRLSQPCAKNYMIACACFAAYGATPTMFILGRMNSESYVDILIGKLYRLSQVVITCFNNIMRLNVSRSLYSWFEAISA